LGFKLIGTAVVEAGVESGAIVEGFDVTEEGGARLGAGGEATVIDQLIFSVLQEDSMKALS
jgi:hypothetical protein